MNKFLAERLSRAITAGLITSGLSVKELEQIRKDTEEFSLTLNQAIEMTLLALRHPRAQQARDISDKSSHAVNELMAMIDRGSLSKDELINSLREQKILPLSESTMKKMPTRMLVERVFETLGQPPIRKFLKAVSGPAPSDPYLRGIDKSRSEP